MKSLALVLLLSGAALAEAAAAERGLALYRHKQFSEAIPFLESATASQHEARLWLALGECYRNTHEYEKAKDAYRHLLANSEYADYAERARSLMALSNDEQIAWERDHPPPPPPAAAALPAAVAAKPSVPRTAAPDIIINKSKPTPVVPLLFLGAGVAAAGAGTALGLNTISSAKGASNSATTADYNAKMNSASSTGKLATVAWIGAALLAATGLVLLINW